MNEFLSNLDQMDINILQQSMDIVNNNIESSSTNNIDYNQNGDLILHLLK